MTRHNKRMQSGMTRTGVDGSRRLDPWELVWGQPYIDSDSLAAAIEQDLQRSPRPDFRSRLLVRDATRALKSYWGQTRFAGWLENSPVRERIAAILGENLGEPGFHDIRRRLVASVSKNQVEQIFELLGQHVRERIEVHVAGSIPTLIEGLTHRPTDDIDIVDEVPPQIRGQRAMLRQIRTKYGLNLGHVQSHYLPANWKNRRRYLGEFGGIRVFLADVYDVFVSKLSSRQEKHRDDLRVMAPQLDKEKIKQRLLEDGKAFLKSTSERPRILANWQFIFREKLFSEAAIQQEQKLKKTDRASKKKKGRKRDPS
jgi:hypothetical protein